MLRNTIPAFLVLLSMLLCGLFMFSLFSFSDTDQSNKQFDKDRKEKYAVYALDIPDNLDFAGEEVPLKMWDIHDRLDRELLVNTYWQSQTLLLIKRSYRYFPVIEPILKENGVPEDFKFLCVAESGIQNVVSPAGATGYWQFLKTTALEYDLEVNKDVDERYHLEKSTEAFCKYILEAKERFGSWTLAAASYNMGMGGLSVRLTEQKVNSYYDLLLNDETSRYLFRLLAFKEILSKPDDYGFKVRPSDLYEPIEYTQIEVKEPVQSWTTFSKENNINYKILKIHNPWLRSSSLSSTSGETYSVKLPKKGYYSITSFSDTTQ